MKTEMGLKILQDNSAKMEQLTTKMNLAAKAFARIKPSTPGADENAKYQLKIIREARAAHSALQDECNDVSFIEKVFLS